MQHHPANQEQQQRRRRAAVGGRRQHTAWSLARLPAGPAPLAPAALVPDLFCPAARFPCASPSLPPLQYSQNEIRVALESSDEGAKVEAMQKAITAILAGEQFPALFITIVRYVLPSENHMVQKLLLLYLVSGRAGWLAGGLAGGPQGSTGKQGCCRHETLAVRWCCHCHRWLWALAMWRGCGRSCRVQQ